MAEYIFTNLPQYIRVTPRTDFSNSVVHENHVLLFSEDGETLTGKLSDGSFITIGGGSGGTDVSDTTAEAADVLSGKIFFTSGGVMTSGTIPTVSASLSANITTVPAGYISSPQTLTVPEASSATVTGNVVTIPAGYVSSQSQVTVGSAVSSATITPTTSNQIISSGVYLGGEQTILGDANLVGSNILSGVSIFGVPGELIASGGAEVTLGYISSGLFQPLEFYGTMAFDSGSAVNLSCYQWNLPASSGNISSGAIITSETTVSSGWIYLSAAVTSAHFYVDSGGIAIQTHVLNSGFIGFSGGRAQKTTIDSGASVMIYSSGIANSTTINSGELNAYNSGAIASNTIVNSGGRLIIASGFANHVTVNFGGSMSVGYTDSGADNVTVSSGGTMIYHGSGVTNLTSMTGAVIINS